MNINDKNNDNIYYENETNQLYYLSELRIRRLRKEGGECCIIRFFPKTFLQYTTINLIMADFTKLNCLTKK